MTPSALAVIAVTIVFSSFLSGVFGMAGGMILLGVLLNYFDVAAGMILFSIIQIVANGWRAVQWRHYVLWPIFLHYVLGAELCGQGADLVAPGDDQTVGACRRGTDGAPRVPASQRSALTPVECRPKSLLGRREVLDQNDHPVLHQSSNSLRRRGRICFEYSSMNRDWSSPG